MKKNTLFFTFFVLLLFNQTIKAQCPVANSCTPSIAVNAALGFNGGIFKVTLNNISKTTLGSTNGYMDYSCTDSTSLIIGENYTITIVNGSINEDVKVWLDFDNNGSFDASNELIFTSLNKKVHTGIISVPTGTATNTPIRMRVSSDYTGSTATNPITTCSTPQYGQVEDYSIYAHPNTSKPSTNFSSDIQNTICDGTIDFIDNTSNLPLTWTWYFGDGDSSFLQNPTHTYLASGNFDITLITSNSYGYDTLTKSNFINFNTSKTTAASCSPSTLSYCCNYGFSKFTLDNFIQNSGYASEGYMDFSCLSVTNTYSEGTIYNLSFQTGTNKQDFKIYLDLNNDGVFNESTELIKTILGIANPNTTITFPSGAIKGTPIRLRVMADSEGQTFQSCSNLLKGQCEDYAVIILENPTPPIADFYVDIREKCDSFFQFTNTSINSIDSLIWSFGDGTFSNISNPLHKYPNEGVYTVKLKVFNKFGIDSLQKNNYIVRKKKPMEICSIVSGGPQWFDFGVKNFIFNNVINNTSGDNTKSYKDYSCDYTVEVEAGSDYFISVYTGTEENEEVKVFVDWNNNGTIEFGELLFEQIAFNNHSGTVTIPTKDLVVLNTKLRLRVISGVLGGGGPGGNGVESACDDVFGEAEDYSIFVTAQDGFIELDKNEFQIYPNPSNGLISISNDKNISINSIYIYNTIGNLVYSKNNILQNEINLNLDLENGLYIVKIDSENSKIVQKLIIN